METVIEGLRNYRNMAGDAVIVELSVWLVLASYNALIGVLTFLEHIGA